MLPDLSTSPARQDWLRDKPCHTRLTDTFTLSLASFPHTHTHTHFTSPVYRCCVRWYQQTHHTYLKGTHINMRNFKYTYIATVHKNTSWDGQCVVTWPLLWHGPSSVTLPLFCDMAPLLKAHVSAGLYWHPDRFESLFVNILVPSLRFFFSRFLRFSIYAWV